MSKTAPTTSRRLTTVKTWRALRRPPVPIALALAALAAIAAGATPPPASGPMAWAYPAAAKDRPDFPGLAPTFRFTYPGSALRLTVAQLDDPWAAVDWLPTEHPAAPSVVLHGRGPALYACALCHMVDGQGGRGVPALAGLTAPYIAAQVRAFAAGQRRSSFALRDAGNMTDLARAARPGELAAAATYYARLRYRPWIRVVETPVVAPTAPSYWGWTDTLPGPARQPIGLRIVEVAENQARAAMSDPRSGFVAYVPPGAVTRGRQLAERGVAGQPPCAACHGPDLRGSTIAPALAGRSPTYLARQLWDLHTTARHNPAAAPMHPIAAALDTAAIVDVSAYLASLRP